ncbi:hybrid sensor histidine kinase/response regulator [Phormidesmis priestleyi ULC007]|uniref:histidine kinase n=1 Tax=Phormidesmis priestleyi ULC007 TaxID=1920490 RepID=A0A2T1DHF0_9CYAN|nr:hybrid sensor histidine kinase/response regulator [Phormidesmis priestleyi]PSB19908.1 hybrid sensor histidine kinase/response regulator [Phormidesmis priestleyi ULC007]PZO49236.1 MAG: hybrid sensor histidine kinase/response regulator [Phormidesmis priestleyi]
MQPEQQQRIMGYFIEEAKDHLNTIEQGLLNLQNTIADPEMVNEVFRAAHSVKGGAAMLGLSSIQKTSHRLEDFFKILKETPGIKPDQNVETLLLRVFDTLQELLEQLQGPFGLTEETSNATMVGVEPVFEELQQYLNLLERQGAATIAATATDRRTIAKPPATFSQDSALVLIFQNDVPAQLREMLQLFRQAETLPDGRDRLQAICTELRGSGEAFDLHQWCSLVNLASRAMADLNNSYRALAPIVIRDLKQAQESVLAGRGADVVPSEQLIALVPIDAALPLAVDDDLSDFFAMTDLLDSDDELDLSGVDFAAEPNSLDVLELDDLTLDAALFESGTDSRLVEDPGSESGDRNGPEMGMAELNSLADLFEGEMPDLGATWQEEEVIGSTQSSTFDLTGAADGGDSSDFSDLLFDSATPSSADSTDDDLTSLFGDDLLEELSNPEVNSEPIVEPTLFFETASDDEDFDLFNLDTPEERSTSSADDLFDNLSLDSLDELNLASETSDNSLEAASSPADDEATPLGDLGELFAERDDEDLSFEESLSDPIAASSPTVDADLSFDGLDLDSLLDEDLTPAASIADPWENLEVEESPPASRLKSDNQNGLGVLADDPFGDLADLDFGLTEEPATSLDSLDALPLTAPDPETADLSLTDDLWSLSEPSLEAELPPNLDAELERLDFGSDTPTSDEESLEFSNSLFAETESDDSTELDLTLFGSELPSSLEVSEADDDLLTGLLDSEDSEETLLELEIDALEPEDSLNREPGLFDSDFEFDLNSSPDVLDLLAEDSELWSNDLPRPDLTDLNDFLGLSSEDEINLSDRPEETPAVEAPFSLNLETDSESDPADLAELFGSEASLGFNLDQPEESLDLNLNALETSDELDSLFDENSEDLGLLFAEDPASDLETTDSLGFPMTAEQGSEESIADSPASHVREGAESDEPSTDLDDLLGLDLTEEETALDFDLLSTSDPSDSLDDLLDSSLAEEADLLGFDLLGDDRSENPPFDSALNLENELFGMVSSEESESLELTDDLIAEQSLFGLDSDELSLESPDSLNEADFDLFSEGSEPITSEAELSDPLSSDLELDLQDSAFDLESFDDSEQPETDASPTEAADNSGFNPLLGAGIAAASVASLGAAMAASHRPDESSDEAELDALLGSETSEPEANAEADSELGDLDDFLSDDLLDLSETSDTENFDDLDGLFGEAAADPLVEAANLDPRLDAPSAELDEFDDLNALLGDHRSSTIEQSTSESFDDLESLLANAPEPLAATSQTDFSAYASDSDLEFDDLEKMLEDADKTMGGTPSAKGLSSVQSGRRTNRPGKGLSEQTMRVPVKHLDNLSNLVGELVVNRNSLEQDQERMRQSLDNLLYQVQQLSDVGQRMQDLYERSLLESSLLASRSQRTSSIFGASRRDSAITPNNSSEVEYDPLEMDRFTGFHSLSQEMIELIVRVRESASDIGFIVDETDQVTRMFRQVTTQLQEGLTRSRMVPFAQTADRLPRAVRDIAMKCGKQAELVIEGRETLIDKMILEHLYDPMTHLVNNAITHGIETPEVRRAAGKSPIGQITIRAFHQGNQTVISVSDDGAGVDIERVKVKAIEKGLITSAESKSMARLDIYDLLFHPGFTTKDQADDFSGRGVGMDVVRTSLSEIRGVINTDSAMNKGTTFTVRLPLTLSISKALCCVSDRARVAFPMDGVEDMLDIPKDRIQTNAEGNPAIAWRDSVLTLRPLTELLGYNRHLSRGNVYGGNQEDDMVSVVVLRSAGNYLALQVDQVLGEQEIVIKQLEGPIPKPIGVAGATVLGDGRIMPIADVLELIDLSMGRIRRDVGTMWDQGAAQSNDTITMKTEPTVLIVDDSITVRELLSMTFNKVGYRVEQARDGQEAWEKLRAGLPCDIVFCDIEMPRMDGLELLSRIQKDPNLSSLPIAMLTSRGADRHRQMAASLGASGYFTKPYLEEALLDAAQRMLKGEILIVNNRQ